MPNFSHSVFVPEPFYLSSFFKQLGADKGCFGYFTKPLDGTLKNA